MFLVTYGIVYGVRARVSVELGVVERREFKIDTMNGNSCKILPSERTCVGSALRVCPSGKSSGSRDLMCVVKFTTVYVGFDLDRRKHEAIPLNHNIRANDETTNRSADACGDAFLMDLPVDSVPL